MELILDQLELGTEHSLVLTEKLFEHHSYKEIQEFQRQIQAKLIKKNKQLKDVFSTKYQDLLDCSELVNGITRYTKQIVQVQEIQKADVLHQLLNPSPQQIQQEPKLAIRNPAQELRMVLFKISNEIAKIQSQGMILVPFLLADWFRSILKDSPVNSSHKGTIKEYIFLMEQTQKTIINSVKKGKSISEDKLLNNLTRKAIVIDYVLFHLYQGQSIEQLFESLSKIPMKDPFKWFLVNMAVTNQLLNIHVGDLKKLNQGSKEGIQQLMKIKGYDQFIRYVEGSYTEQLPEAASILQQIREQTLDLIKANVQRVVILLVQGDQFNFPLYESVLEDAKLQQTLQESELELNVRDTFKQRWIEFSSERLVAIFSHFNIKIHSLEHYVFGSDLSSSISSDHSDLRNQCRQEWIKQISGGLQEIQLLLARSLVKKDDYLFEENVRQLESQFAVYRQKQNQYRQELVDSESDDLEDQIRSLARITLIFNLLDQIWAEQIAAFQLPIRFAPSDQTFLADKLRRFFNQTQQQPTYFVQLLEDILSQNSGQTNTLEVFANQYISCLGDVQELFQQDEYSMQQLIQYHNILSLLHPNSFLVQFQRHFQPNPNKQKTPKQLRRPNIQLKQIDENPNFILFPSLVPPKKTETLKVDQQGLAMWSQGKATSQVSKPVQGVPAQATLDQQSKLNRFGQVFLSAKEKTTNLLYKQYQ